MQVTHRHETGREGASILQVHISTQTPCYSLAYAIKWPGSIRAYEKDSQTCKVTVFPTCRLAIKWHTITEQSSLRIHLFIAQCNGKAKFGFTRAESTQHLCTDYINSRIVCIYPSAVSWQFVPHVQYRLNLYVTRQQDPSVSSRIRILISVTVLRTSYFILTSKEIMNSRDAQSYLIPILSHKHGRKWRDVKITPFPATSPDPIKLTWTLPSS